MSAQYPTLILPKPHLSWSQLSCWISNRNRYVKEYFEAGPKLDTRHLRFGGEFSRMVEELCGIMASGVPRPEAVRRLRQARPFDENMERVLLELEVDGISEYQIGNSGKEGDATPVCRVRGEVPILCYLDKYVGTNIREYKTGLAPWTMAKVQKHDQLPFYGVGLKWIGRPLPEWADLDWIQTREEPTQRADCWGSEGKAIMATGQIKSFHREFDPREFERMEDLIIRVAWEISDAYQEHLSQL